MAYLRLVLSGGSAKGVLVMTGAVNAIADHGHSIGVGAGTSAGGIVLGALASGISPSQLKETVMDLAFGDFISTGWMSVLRLVCLGSLSNGNELLRFFRAITKDKKFKDAAFDVRITGSDYSRGRLAVFNRVDDPEMPLATAMRITSAMPGAFSAVEYDGAWYKDGGVYAHVPVEASRAIDKTVVVALAHDHSNGSGREEWSANMGLVKEVERTVDLLVDANVHAQMEKAPADTVKVFLSSLGYGSFDFDLALDEKDELYRHGYDRTKKMLLMAGL